MTDKVQKIRKEVERLMDELVQEKEKGFGSDVDDACILELQNVLTFIDSLQEEPVSRTPADIEAAMQEVEEKSMDFTEAHQGEDADTILAQMRGEEPVSEDLDSFAEEYSFNIPSDIYNLLPKKKQSLWAIEIENAIKAGAQWQKAKDETCTNDLEEVASLYVADDKLKPWCNLTKESFKAGAKWQKANLWKPADGDDLPEIDKEVIVLQGIKNPVTTDSMWGCEVAFAHRPNPDGWDGKSITTGKVEHYDVQTYDKGGWNIPDVKFWLDCELPKIKE